MLFLEWISIGKTLKACCHDNYENFKNRTEEQQHVTVKPIDRSQRHHMCTQATSKYCFNKHVPTKNKKRGRGGKRKKSNGRNHF